MDTNEIQPIEEQELTPLSDKHLLVMEHYLACWNQTEAYCRVYDVDRKSASTAAARLFQSPNFKAHLRIKVDDIHMRADEALKLTTDIARGDITDMMDISSVGFNLDLEKAKSAGLGRLIKKVKQKVTTFSGKNSTDEDREEIVTEIELYDAQAAQRDILKMKGQYPANAQRANEAPGAPGAGAGQVSASVETLLQLVEQIEQHKRAAVDKARAIDPG